MLIRSVMLQYQNGAGILMGVKLKLRILGWVPASLLMMPVWLTMKMNTCELGKGKSLPRYFVKL